MAKTKTEKKKPVREYGERFIPEVGWLVSNVGSKVFFDPVVKVTETDFICRDSGRWTGTSDGWLYHNNIKPRDEE